MLIKVLIALYVSGVFCTALIGLCMIIMGCDDGRNNEYYISGKNLLKGSILFPYTIYKHIKNKLDKADKRSEEEK